MADMTKVGGASRNAFSKHLKTKEKYREEEEEIANPPKSLDRAEKE
jgi:hypothetical protein